MHRFRTFQAFLASTVLLFATAASSQSMSRPLAAPMAVPLDFLAWIDRDAAWLQQQLTTLGAAGDMKIGNEALETSDLETLKTANRIRSFAFLAAKGLRPPYFDLPVASADGPIRCITQYPESIAPDIGPMDFAKKAFPAASADPVQLKACTVAAKGADYSGLDRTAFRDRYFDAHGTLKPEFSDLGDDIAFKAKAIDEGFFLTTEDYSGQLQLGLR